jgi:hypothetical protein
MKTSFKVPLPLLLLLMLPAMVQAQFIFTTNNGTITITGYTGSGGAVTIPDTSNGWPVTSIGVQAFINCYSLTSVTIPRSVTNIGNNAFYGCDSLTSATIPNSVISIGEYAFFGTSLTSITIPNSVTSIGDRAFGDCTRLTAITVDALNSVYCSVAGVLFNKSQTTLIQCPGGKEGSYTIPNSVTNIGNNAFFSCWLLTSVTIGTNVTNIGNSAFYECDSLTSVTVPSSVTSIGYGAFGDCTRLTAITVAALNSVYCSVAGVLFNKSQTTLSEYPAGKAGTSYTIPNSVTSIGGEAFRGCYSLTNVTIPNSVSSIQGGAFYACTNLTGVYFQGNAPSLDWWSFDGDNNATIYYLPGTTGWSSPFGGRPTALWNLCATATATIVNGFVVSATVSNGGYGYSNAPLVRFIGGGGSGAQAVAVVSNGVVVGITITDAGIGYTNAPLVVIEPPFIPNPVLDLAPMSFLTFSNLTLGGVYQLQQLVGWYWSNQPVSFTATNALYTQMVAGVADSGDYRLAFNPVPAQAFATVQVVNGFVMGATVSSGGSGYVTSPAVTVVGGGGANATAISHISGGVVTSITITDAGIGYTNAPTVRIAPPPAAAVSPTVLPMMRVDSANLAPYDNYQIQFKSDLGGAWANWNGGLFSPTAATNSQYLFITNGVGFFRLQYVP